MNRFLLDNASTVLKLWQNHNFKDLLEQGHNKKLHIRHANIAKPYVQQLTALCTGLYNIAVSQFPDIINTISQHTKAAINIALFQQALWYFDFDFNDRAKAYKTSKLTNTQTDWEQNCSVDFVGVASWFSTIHRPGHRQAWIGFWRLAWAICLGQSYQHPQCVSIWMAQLYRYNKHWGSLYHHYRMSYLFQKINKYWSLQNPQENTAI